MLPQPYEIADWVKHHISQMLGHDEVQALGKCKDSFFLSVC